MNQQETMMLRASIDNLVVLDEGLAKSYRELMCTLNVQGTWAATCPAVTIMRTIGELKELLNDSKPTQSEPEFKVGDKVMVNPRCGKEIDKVQCGMPWPPQKDETIGQIGKITNLYDDGKMGVGCLDRTWHWHYYPVHLIKLSE